MITRLLQEWILPQGESYLQYMKRIFCSDIHILLQYREKELI